MERKNIKAGEQTCIVMRKLSKNARMTQVLKILIREKNKGWAKDKN